jgi:hypothetical protein
MPLQLCHRAYRPGVRLPPNRCASVRSQKVCSRFSRPSTMPAFEAFIRRDAQRLAVLSTPDHEFVPGFLGSLVVQALSWVRWDGTLRRDVDPGRATRWP